MALKSIYDYALERLRNNDTLSADEIWALEAVGVCVYMQQLKETPADVEWMKVIIVEDRDLYAIHFKLKKQCGRSSWVSHREYFGQPYKVRRVERVVQKSEVAYEPIEE